MEIVQNKNGNIYKVLKKKDLYLLLQNVDEKLERDKYVVAFNFSGGVWTSGTYFTNLDNATNFFETKY